MIKSLSKDLTYLPVTMQQFENLTNELLAQINILMGEHKINGDFMASVLMSAIHAIDHKTAIINKTTLFESCINRISNQVTFHAVEAIQKRLVEQQQKDNPQPLSVVPDSDSAH